MSQTEVDRTSIEQQDPHLDDKNPKVKSRRPANNAFRQQRLKAWQPILTPKTVLPLLFVVGVIFAPLGGVLLWASNQVEEISIDYSECLNQAPSGDFADIPDDKVHKYFKPSNFTGAQRPQWRRYNTTTRFDGEETDTPTCRVVFDIENDLGPPVLLYYRLTEFYQNHRRYVKSYDQNQLKGDFRSNSSIHSSDCDPLRLDHNGKAYYPCGLIANSLFNDSFTSPVQQNANDRRYNMTTDNIAWHSDRDLYGKSPYTNDQVVPPPNWIKRYPKGYTDANPQPDLKDWDEFQVWMRTAGLPTFSKLARRNDDEVMRAGRYEMNITDNFPVLEYGGTKSILISTRTVMGGKNPFLGIAYVVVGGVCVLLGALFTVLHLIKPRKLGDHTYLSWNNVDQPAHATASGRQLRAGGGA